MTDKLHCPFCGAELKYTADPLTFADEFYCSCKSCDWGFRSFPEGIWQALIAGKAAQDALKYAIKVLDNLTEIGGIDLEIMKIKEIASITKQDKQ